VLIPGEQTATAPCSPAPCCGRAGAATWWPAGTRHSIRN